MRVVRTVLLAVVVVIVAGCGIASSSPASSREPAGASLGAPSGGSPTAVPSLAIGVPRATPTATHGPAATPQPTAVPVPATPTGVTFDVVRQVETKNGYRETYRVTWKWPRREDLVIRVWGVTRCLSERKPRTPGTSGPCLVPHTALPASVLEPIANAPASAGKVAWTWDTIDYCDTYDYLWKAEPTPVGKTYFAVVIAAYTGSNHSVFAIPFAGSWSEPLPTDVIC